MQAAILTRKQPAADEFLRLRPINARYRDAGKARVPGFVIWDFRRRRGTSSAARSCGTLRTAASFNLESDIENHLTSRPMRLNRTAHGEMIIRAMFGAASEEK